jgi:hypothetical protein
MMAKSKEEAFMWVTSLSLLAVPRPGQSIMQAQGPSSYFSHLQNTMSLNQRPEDEVEEEGPPLKKKKRSKSKSHKFSNISARAFISVA